MAREALPRFLKLTACGLGAEKTLIAKWETALDKPYDAATQKSSALFVVASRSIFAEVCVRNKFKVCAALFGLHQFSLYDPRYGLI